MGSSAIDLAYVASGIFDGFFEYHLSPWDVAAGICLVREAGGYVSDFQGEDNALFGRQLIAGGAVHPALLEAIKIRWN
jgi:myo-inositol-1(or 4)-monophosphatase